MNGLLMPFLLLLVSVSACAQQRSELPANYRTIITTWIEEDNAGMKPKDAPYAAVDREVRIYTGDLDADGDADCVADYGVTFGGNALTQYLAVFLNDNGTLSKGHKKEVGSMGGMMLDSISIVDGTIMATTLIWNADDGYCCPSGKGRAKFAFRAREIREI